MTDDTKPTEATQPPTAGPDAAATEASLTVTEPGATATEPIPTVAEPDAAGTGPEAAEAPPSPAAILPAGSTGTTTRVRRRDRALGTTGQVAAIVGIVVSLALILGVLLGRGWLVGTVDDVAGTIDGGLAKGVPLLDKASARVSEVSGRVGAAADAANAIAANPNPAPGLTEALSSQMTAITERYLALRSGYTDLRSTVVAALDRLNTLGQLVPWFSIPEGPVGALQTLDTRVQAIDAQVSDLLAASGAGVAGSAAGTIATKATDVQTGLQSVTAAIDDANARLATLRVDVQTKADQIKLVINLGSVLLILGLVYSAFLHWVLFRASSGRRRKVGAA